MLNMERATVYFSVNGIHIHLLAKIETMETGSRKFELLLAMDGSIPEVSHRNIHIPEVSHRNKHGSIPEVSHRNKHCFLVTTGKTIQRTSTHNMH